MLSRVFSMIAVKSPDTGKVDPMLSLTVFVVIICGIKFLFEGMTIEVAGHSINMGHADALTYGALLTPVLSTHGYVSGRKQGRMVADNPDQECVK